MPWIIPALTALASGVSNLISGNAQENQMKKNINRAKDQLKESIITQDELDKFLHANSMAFNKNIQSLLNTTAIRSRGIANSNVVGAAAAAPMEAAKLQSDSDIRFKAKENNIQVNNQIANLDLQMPASDPLGNFVSGAASGASLGMEIDKFGTAMSILDKGGVNPDTGESTAPASPEERQGALDLLASVGGGNKPNDSFGLGSLFGANKTKTALNSLNTPDNPYRDYLGDDQLMNKQKRWMDFLNYTNRTN